MGHINIIVDNRLRLDPTTPDWVVRRLCVPFIHKNPKFAELKSRGYYAAKEPEFIRTYEIDENDQASFPRGGTDRLRSTLKDIGYEWAFRDLSVEGMPASIPPHRRTPYGYQEEAITMALRRRNCLIRAPTGAGKTTIALAITARLQRYTLIIVHQYGLEKQWMERIVDELGIPASDIGIIGGGKFRIRPVTIGIQKSIFNIMEKGGEEADELRRTFGLVIGDEIQLFAARTFIGCIDPFPAKYRLGISADETRADRKEFLIYDLFGKVAADIPKERVLEQGAIVDVEIRVYPTNFTCPEYTDAYRPDFNLLLERMKYDVDRNEVVMNAIAEARKLGTVMVFSHRIDHCHLIDSMCAEARIKSGLMIGSKEWASAFDATKLGLKQGTIDVAIGTIKAIGQGLDIPSVNSGVVTTPLAGGKGKQQFGQVRGRICRASHGKSVGFIHYIWDRHIVGIAALRNLIRWNTKVVVLNDGVWVDAKRYVQLLRKSLTDFSKGGM